MRKLAVSFVWVCSLLLLCVGSAQTGEEVVVICPFSVDRLDYYRLLYNPAEFYNRHSRRVITVPHQLARTASPEECAPEQESTCAGCNDLQLTRYECFHARPPERRSDCGDNWCIVAEVHVKYCPGRPGGNQCRVSRVNRWEYERQCGTLPPPAKRHTVKYYRRHGERWCTVRRDQRTPEEQDLGHERHEILYGCPTCIQHAPVTFWCLADERSAQICKNGRRVDPEILGQENPIEDESGFVCTKDDCSLCPRNSGNGDPRQERPEEPRTKE